MEKKAVLAVSFLDKVLGRLNMSDDGKVGLVIDTIQNTYKKEIKAYERKISDLKVQEADKLADLNEELKELIVEKDEVVVSIDKDAIGTNADRKDYVSTYTTALARAMDAVANKKLEIKNYSEAVEKKVKEFQESVDKFQGFLNEMA